MRVKVSSQPYLELCQLPKNPARLMASNSLDVKGLPNLVLPILMNCTFSYLCVMISVYVHQSGQGTSEHFIKQSFRVPIKVDLLLDSLRIDLRCDRRSMS